MDPSTTLYMVPAARAVASGGPDEIVDGSQELAEHHGPNQGEDRRGHEDRGPHCIHGNVDGRGQESKPAHE